MHCSASLLTLAIFEKQFTNFLNNPFIFSNEKNLNFFYVLRNLVYSVEFYSKFAAVSGFQNCQGFHSRNQFMFSWRNHVWNVLRYLTNSVAFYSKIATSYHFSKNHKFFPKNTFFSFNKTNFCTFWEFLHFQWPCSANLLFLSILKNSSIFSKNQSMFVQKERKFRTFWEVLLIWLHSASNSLLFGGFFKEKLKIFFSKNQSFFQEETTFLTFWETLLFQLHLITNFYLWRFFEKSLLFFRKTYTIYLLKPIFERFERSYLSNRILPQVCFVQRFFVKIHCLFSKHPPYFSIKKPKFRTFWELLLIQSHSKAFLLRLMIFIKKTVFFWKTHRFQFKKNRFWAL